MILRSTDPKHAPDERTFREYIEKRIGDDDAIALVTFIHERSATPDHYMGSLARVVEGLRIEGPDCVAQAVEMAKRSREFRDAAMDLGVFAKRTVDEITAGIIEKNRALDAAEHQKVIEEAWLEMRERTAMRLKTIWPKATNEDLGLALAAGCVWDTARGTIGIVANRLVEVMCQRAQTHV